jgi:hypothetical protein
MLLRSSSCLTTRTVELADDIWLCPVIVMACRGPTREHEQAGVVIGGEDAEQATVARSKGLIYSEAARELPSGVHGHEMEALEPRMSS